MGQHWSYNLIDDPKRLGFVLSRYKFASRLCARGNRVLELGCSEGLGAAIVAETAACYVGVDLDEEAIEVARRNWPGAHVSFLCADFLGGTFGEFDAVMSVDVIEHIAETSEELFFDTILGNLHDDGLCVIGTPNKEAERYASPVSVANHVNLYTADRLRVSMEKRFRNVFVFSMNDEIVHTGFAAMAHFLIAVGSGVKRAASGKSG